MNSRVHDAYAKHAIRVERTMPGMGRHTPLVAQMGERDAIERYIRDSVPLGRWADDAKIAELILFLVSGCSSYVTGQILVVDGGETVV